jgi:hypothetical protein
MNVVASRTADRTFRKSSKSQKRFSIWMAFGAAG